MALLICNRCGTKYSVGAPYCPQCTSTDFREEGEVPKTTVHAGATNDSEDVVHNPVDLADVQPQDPDAALSTFPEEPVALPYEDVPEGSVAEVLAWVGNDSARASRALHVEYQKYTPRTTLVNELEKRAV